MTTCKNCGHQFDGNFCNSCGQSAHTHAINGQYVVHEIQHGIFHVDRGFFFTIKELFTRPGHSIREYIDGKRVDHFKPLAFLLILSTIYAYLSHALHDDPFVAGALTGFRAGAGETNSKGLFVVIDWLLDHYAYTSLLLIPVYSLASYLAFLNARCNFFQHLILNAFVSGQATVVHIVYLFITYLINKNSPSYAADFIELGIGTLLMFWTYFQFFSTVKPLPKVILTTLSCVLSVVFMMVSLALLLLITKTFLLLKTG